MGSFLHINNFELLRAIVFKLCRFYTKQSWFLHGRAENGPTEPPVIGQEVIKQISLNELEILISFV